MNTNQYENYYGVQLLNDLHNYFPDILYGNRFQNDPLVSYIREQVASRFNLYNNAQNQFFNNHRIMLQNQHTSRLATIPQIPQIPQIPVTPPHPSTYNNPTSPPSPFNLYFTSSTSSGLNPFVNIINTLLQEGLDIPTNLQSVVVRPTTNEINTATSIVEVTNPQDSCAICQERMNPSDRIRRLNHCRHMFHDNCIMTAFESSVRCPVCRHDIREVRED